MLIQEIQTNGEDLAGGELIRARLDKHYGTLITLNIIDTMMLELSLSPKEIRGVKQTLTLEAGTDTGTVDISALNLDKKIVRWRRDTGDSWHIMDVVQDIEDLSRKANAGKEAILFVGTKSPLTYYLSFTPAEEITAELWGKQLAGEVTDLNDEAAFPPEFGLCAAYRIADFLLNQLLIIDAKGLGLFVAAQKQSIKKDSDRCEFIWTGYRVHIPDSSSMARSTDYNYLADDISDAEFDDDVIIEPGGLDVDLIQDP
jgi:hypothetical protein